MSAHSRQCLLYSGSGDLFQMRPRAALLVVKARWCSGGDLGNRVRSKGGVGSADLRHESRIAPGLPSAVCE